MALLFHCWNNELTEIMPGVPAIAHIRVRATKTFGAAGALVQHIMYTHSLHY